MENPARPPRLLERVHAVCRARHFSRRTERAYRGWIVRFIRFNGLRHPMDLGETEVSSFLNHLAIEGKVAASTQNQALAALLFLYKDVLGIDLPWLKDLIRAKRPARVPTVLSRGEGKRILENNDGVALMALLLYGAGLRLLECCRLRVKDIDFERRQIVVRAGKGEKDRITFLPRAAHNTVRRQIQFVLEQHTEDCQRGAGWVELPYAFGK